MRPVFRIVLVLMGVASSLVPAHAGNAADDDDVALITEPLWGIQLRFPGFQEWDDHPMNGEPNLVVAGTSESERCLLNMSMFAEIVPAGTSADECRKDYRGNPEILKNRSDVTLHEHATTPITYSLFDEVHDERAVRIVQHQLYGYWTQKDTCFELHVSSVRCDDFRAVAMPVLESVRLPEDRGVTPETVAVARAAGGRPGDWRVHLFVAGQYLHAAEPPQPSRARRFYLSALDLAGQELDPVNRWIIEEGIGIAWLIDNDGERAIPPLSRALEVAEENANPEWLSSTLYNIACAYALTGDADKACGYLDDLLSRQEGRERKKTLKEIRKDDQLAVVRESSCYQALSAGSRGE